MADLLNINPLYFAEIQVMTDEQIKQNAEAHASYFYPRNSTVWQDRYHAYIAGAHSRDEEIRRLHNVINDYSKTIDKLRNPWISVEERLPKEHSKVLIMFCNGTVTYNDYIGVGDINYIKAHSKTITHWMPIQKPESDEK